VGSIAYTAALSHNGYDNDIARLTRNILRRFIDPAALLGTDSEDAKLRTGA